MKVLMNSSGVLRDVSPDVGEELVRSGAATEVVPSKPSTAAQTAAKKAPVNMTYSIAPANQFGPPFIKYHCTGCDAKGYTQGPNAHVNAIRHTGQHLGIVSHPPADIAEEYQRLFAKWKARAPKPAPIIAADGGYTCEDLRAYRPKSVA